MRDSTVMRYLATGSCLLWLLSLPAPGADRALLVGINDYQHHQVRDLDGCVNDIEAIHDILIGDFGLASGSIRVLSDAAASPRRRQGLRPGSRKSQATVASRTSSVCRRQVEQSTRARSRCPR